MPLTDEMPRERQWAPKTLEYLILERCNSLIYGHGLSAGGIVIKAHGGQRRKGEVAFALCAGATEVF